MRKRLLALASLVCCLTLFGCSGDETPKATDEDASTTGGVGGNDNTGGKTGGEGWEPVGGDGSGMSPTGGTGGTSSEIEPFFCNDVLCMGLEAFFYLGDLNPYEYCCTPSNACSIRLTTDTDCPDPLTCGGVQCPQIPGSPFVGDIYGSVCCSPSDKCSYKAPGEAKCPEPADPDPDCPSMSDMMGGYPVPPEVAVYGGDGCCIGNVCGLLVMGTCIDIGPMMLPIGGILFDCDGIPLQWPVWDGGIPVDGGMDADVDAETDAETDADTDADEFDAS